MYSGEKYFNYLITLGKDLPYFPLEIRKKIFNYIYYNVNCLVCNEVIITSRPSIILYTDGFSYLQGNGMCNLCKSHLSFI